jgi:hypothetical protein
MVTVNDEVLMGMSIIRPNQPARQGEPVRLQLVSNMDGEDL